MARVELERLDAEHVPGEMPLPLRADDGVPRADDVDRPLDALRRSVVGRLTAEPGGKVRVLGRDLQLAGRVGGVGVVRAPEVVPNARVTEPADEDTFPARAGREGREEDVRFRLDERDREAAERVADDDVRRRDRRCVLRDTRGDVLARADPAHERHARGTRAPRAAGPTTSRRPRLRGRERRSPCDDPPMRVIAGSRKGHKLAAPRGLDTRPTSDRVRENVFNLVGPVDDARVLDLFAGSGAMGIEALSRGAASAVFVEHDADAVRTIERNLDRLRLTGARVVRGDVLRAIAQEATAGAKYDLVLVDPPYGMLTEIQPRLARHLPPLVAADGLVVVETDARTEPELPLPVRTSRKYGQTRVTLFEAAQ